VYVLDVSDPAQPQRLSDAIRTRGVVYGLSYQANRLYIAVGRAGLEIWDMTNPGAPARLGYCDTPGNAYGVAVIGDYAFVANGDSGLHVLQFCGGGVQETMNDGRGKMNDGPTVVRGILHLPASGVERGASSVLLDASGRKIMALHPGANDVSRLAPGVYFVRAVSREPSTESCRKVVIQR
jgi:hypothetical protein